MSNYDSTGDTKKHMIRVAELIHEARYKLLHRAIDHDLSKLLPPEKEAFDEITPLLKGSTYGSPEYRATLDRMRPTINHHQTTTRLHPEYFGDEGISGMNLIDLVEMLCDWKAASERRVADAIIELVKGVETSGTAPSHMDCDKTWTCLNPSVAGDECNYYHPERSAIIGDILDNH